VLFIKAPSHRLRDRPINGPPCRFRGRSFRSVVLYAKLVLALSMPVTLSPLMVGYFPPFNTLWNLTFPVVRTLGVITSWSSLSHINSCCDPLTPQTVSFPVCLAVAWRAVAPFTRRGGAIGLAQRLAFCGFCPHKTNTVKSQTDIFLRLCFLCLPSDRWSFRPLLFPGGGR